MFTIKRFPERLKELRTDKGLSQRDLAKAIDLSQSSIVQWENNGRVPSADVIIVLAKFFDVTAGYLLGLEN